MFFVPGNLSIFLAAVSWAESPCVRSDQGTPPRRSCGGRCCFGENQGKGGWLQVFRTAFNLVDSLHCDALSLVLHQRGLPVD